MLKFIINYFKKLFKKPEPKPIPIVNAIPKPIKGETTPEQSMTDEYYSKKRKMRKRKLRISRVSRRSNRKI